MLMCDVGAVFRNIDFPFIKLEVKKWRKNILKVLNWMTLKKKFLG
jgi:hypothetical protein